MSSSNILKVIEYFLLPHMEKHFPLHLNYFAHRAVTGCIDATTVLRETVVFYNLKWSNVYCAEVDLSKTYDRIVQY